MPGNDLATRVANQAATRPAAPVQTGLKHQIQQMGEQFQLAMPRGFDANQLVRDALTCLSATPQLASCDPISVLGGLMTCAQLGLRPAVLGQAWLLPMWDRRSGGNKATLVVGYKGYLELVHRSGQVESVNAHIIHENDTWDVEYGDSEHLTHKPNFFSDRGKPILYYATGRKRGASRSEFQIASLAEMQEHRDRYAMAKKKGGEVVGPWRDNFDSMALKTMMLRLVKYLPQSPELVMAQIADGGARTELAPHADIVEVTQEVEGELLEGGPTAPAEDPWTTPDNAWPAVAVPGGQASQEGAGDAQTAF
jgi:recombination protein RecT